MMAPQDCTAASTRSAFFRAACAKGLSAAARLWAPRRMMQASLRVLQSEAWSSGLS